MKKPKFSDFWNGIGVNKPPYPGGYRDTIIDAPSTVANYEYLLGALRSKAPGQWSANLLELSRHFTSAAFLAINTLANQAADSEKKVFERTSDPYESDIELPYHEPICRLLECPNNDDGWGDLMYQVVQQLSLTGLGLVWKPTYNENDIPTELYSISTSSALPWPPSPIYQHGSYLIQPYYPYGPFSTIPSYQSAAGARIPAEQIIRIKNHHPVLRYDGYAVLTALQRQVDTVDGIDLARFNTQQNGIDPTVSMSFDPEIFNADKFDFLRLRTQLEALHAGPQNIGRIMFNPLGSTVSKISNTPLEMAWTEGWDQLVKFIVAAYGTPAPITGLADATSYATLYASLRQFHLISLNPLLSKIAIKYNKGLVQPYFGEDLYLYLNGKKITDEDISIKKHQILIPAGVLRKNELRKFADYGPLDGPEGDELVLPVKVSETAKTSLQDIDNEKESNVRPENPEGQGSLGPQPDKLNNKNNKEQELKRKEKRSFKHTQNRLADILDDMKVKGIVQDIEPRKSYLCNGHG